MFDNEFSWLNNKTIALATSVWPSGTALGEVVMPPAPSFPSVGAEGAGGAGDVAAQMAAAGGSDSDGEDAPGIGLPPAIGERAYVLAARLHTPESAQSLCYATLHTGVLCHDLLSLLPYERACLPDAGRRDGRRWN